MASPFPITGTHRGLPLDDAVAGGPRAGAPDSQRPAEESSGRLPGPDADNDNDLPDVAQRLAEWRPSLGPIGPREEWLATQVVVASFRVEECQRDEPALKKHLAERAKHSWDSDRRSAAETLGGRLGRKPALVARKLKKTLQGCDWLLSRWRGLIRVLEVNSTWTDAQRSLAEDLLGTPHELRDAPDRPDPSSPLVTHPRIIAEAEVHRLEQLRSEELEPLDALDRAAAESWVKTTPDPALTRLRRCEAASFRRMVWAQEQIGAQPDAPPEPPANPVPPKRPVDRLREPSPEEEAACRAFEQSLFFNRFMTPADDVAISPPPMEATEPTSPARHVAPRTFPTHTLAPTPTQARLNRKTRRRLEKLKGAR